MIAEARREEIRTLLMTSGVVTVGELQSRFGISPMTARRDLDVLERRGSARRTHGGAVLPSVATPEDSFAKRVEVATDAKQRLAEAAFGRLMPGETIFLDSSSTARDRILTDADSLEAAVKRAMLEQARETVLLMDDSKLTTHGGHAIAPLKDVSLVLGAGLARADAERLRASDVDVRLLAGD